MVPQVNNPSSHTYGSVGEDGPLIPQENIEGGKNENGDDGNDAKETANYLATYFRSWRFAELIVCTIPVAIWVYFETADTVPYQRKIPYQEVLSYNGEPLEGFEKPPIVWSQVHSLKYHGSIVGHLTSEFLNGFVPFVINLLLVWYCAPALSTTFDRLDTLHRTVCMYFVALGTTDAICNFTKFYVGYLRPVFLDMCKPYYDETDENFYCTHEKNNARVSFPSNHAGWAYCGQLLFAMYLSQRFGLPSIQKNGANAYKKITGKQVDRHSYYRVISYLCYAPLLFSYFVAASRLRDKKHFPADVMAGGMLGASVAFMVFGVWFPQ